MQLIDKICAALRGWNIIIDVPALLAGSNHLCADGIAFGVKQADKNLCKIHCRIPRYASVGLDAIAKGQRRLCGAVFYPCQVWAAHAPDFYGGNTADENYFCQRVYAFL